MAAAFKSAVEANSNGEIKVELYPSGVLGKERETMVQVKSGVVQSYISSTGGMSTFYPMIDITNMPFAFSSYNVVYKVYDGKFGQELAKDIEKKSGFHVLGFGESGGFFVITNSKREIKSPKDMKGIKIRTMTVPLHMEIIKSLGGSPTPIAWSEVYTSLQTGVVDGQMNPISIINMAKFYEVQKYATLTNHIYAPYIWVMNAKFYNNLSPAHKAIVDDAARTAILAGRGLSRIIDSTDKGLPVLMSKMLLSAFISIKRGYPKNKKTTFKEKIIGFKEAIIPLLMPVIILGGILSGIFTPTEAAAVAVFYALVIGFFVLKSLKISDLPRCLLIQPK
jgi:tripartite ATP-independent transporter DctP family solute receptor